MEVATDHLEADRLLCSLKCNSEDRLVGLPSLPANASMIGSLLYFYAQMDLRELETESASLKVFRSVQNQVAVPAFPWT